MKKFINISGVKIAPGENGQVNLHIAKLPSRTHIEIPVFINRASEPGPTVLFIAGIHGDEINGIEILRKLLKHNHLIPTRGSVIAIPILNVYGFLNYSRQFPDGRDINRSFPGSHGGSLASRVAQRLMSEIIPHIDFGIDFHTGGSRISNFPQIRCTFNDAKNMELAEAFSAPFTINTAFVDKSLRKEAFKLGKQILVYEGGESMRSDQFAIDEGVNCALRLMASLGMKAKGPKPAFPSIKMNTKRWVRAKTSGLFHPYVKLGERIKKGQLLARITDPYGDFEARIMSPVTGYLIGLNNMPVINQGDGLMHIGMESERLVE